MVRSNRWLAIVASKHSEWVRVVNSLGEYDFAEDIVQESYIALHKYAKPDSVVKKGIVNKAYMYFTLRSLTFQFYNKRKKINKIRVDFDRLEIEEINNIPEKEAFEKFYHLIETETNDWHWYDKKLFDLYKDTNLSIRKIAAETKISWVSIFNTLKNCKQKIKDKHQENYEDLKNEDFDKIR
tara:strand:+ start:4146 stop:4691 length:546 start_codon:yes stop_codon:yes gene_type:complete